MINGIKSDGQGIDVLMDWFLDAADQLEQSRLELSTFKQLKISETVAIPRRLETITEVCHTQHDPI